MCANGGIGCVVALCVCVCSVLTVGALDLAVVARLDEADVAQVEDTCHDLQHLSLDVPRDPDHLHGLLYVPVQNKRVVSGDENT